MPDDLPPGESIFSWAVPLNDAHTPEDDGVAATLTFVDSLLNGVTTVIEAGTIGHLAPAAAAAERTGIRAGLGVWGWDIEHGPFAAPTAETLARQAATLDVAPTRRPGHRLGHARRPRPGVRCAADRGSRPRPRRAGRG